MATRTKLRDSPAVASPASPAPAPSAARRRGHWLRNALLLALAFLVVGLAPMALAARVFGFVPAAWTPGLSLAFPPFAASATPTPLPPDTALPRAAWVAQPIVVRQRPAAGASLAALSPGFPVQLTAHALAGANVWDAVSWTGPTAAAGGHGWVPDAVLTASGSPGDAVGDAGALAPAVASALDAPGVNGALAVYYPAAHELYLTRADQLWPLGDGSRTLLLLALLASPPSNRPQVAGLSPAALPQSVASGDAVADSAVYDQIGGAPGLATFAANTGLRGIEPGPGGWTDVQVTPRTLVSLYAALAGLTPGSALDALSAVRAQALALLAPDAATTELAGLGNPPPAGARVTLVVGTAQDGAGWAVNAAGIITVGGLTYVAEVCVRAQPSQAAGLRALGAVYARLAALSRA